MTSRYFIEPVPPRPESEPRHLVCKCSRPFTWGLHTPRKKLSDVTPSQKFQEKNIIQKIRGISNFIHPHHSKNQPHPGYPASKPETSEFPAVQATWKRTVSLRPGGSLSVNQPAVERLPTMHPRIITTIPVPWWFGNTITPVLGRTPPPNPRYDVIILKWPQSVFSE